MQLSYIELQQLKQIYDNTDQSIIKHNIRQLMTNNKTKHKDLRQILNISEHTTYSYTNKANNNKPELYNLLLLSAYWGISTNDFFTITADNITNSE